MRRILTLSLVAGLVLAALAATGAAKKPAFRPVPPTAKERDALIRPGEKHFAHLWQLTFGGQNAEAYWSADGRRLSFQATVGDMKCDQQYVLDLATGQVTRVSDGTGRTTCGYFYDNDRRVLYASTHEGGAACPPDPDMSQGYIWAVYPTYDIWTAKADGSDRRPLVASPGYDAEGTVSRDGKWMVYTAKRDGDIDLYKIRLDGTGDQRLTNAVGYDGGAFFSHDGRRIVWRTHRSPDTAYVNAFRRLLDRDLVKPSKMDIWVMNADGSGQKQLTDRPGASFAPYFTPDDRQIIYSSNWENPRSRNFDLYLIDAATGGEPVPVTRDEDFDGFPMFSPDGKWLVFCSNRGGSVAGETNIFLAEWKK